MVGVGVTLGVGFTVGTIVGFTVGERDNCMEYKGRPTPIFMVLAPFDAIKTAIDFFTLVVEQDPHDDDAKRLLEYNKKRLLTYLRCK